MMTSPLHSERDFAKEALPRIVCLEPEYYEKAEKISQNIDGENNQWKAYLNQLAFLGFEEWLKEQLPDMKVKQTGVNLQVSEFKVQLITVDNLVDDFVTISQENIESPQLAAHFYVLVEVLEEVEQLRIHGLIRHDELCKIQRNINDYQIPLSSFDNQINNLLIYTRFLEPEAIPLPNAIPTPDDKAIASASQDGTVKLWNADNNQLLHTIARHKSKVSKVRFSPDGKVIAFASKDRTVKLWNTDNGKLLHILSGHKSEVYEVKFSLDGKIIASASEDKIVKLWNRDNGQLLHTITGHKSGISRVEFRLDGKTIAFASEDKIVKLWNRDNDQLLHTLSGHKSEVNSIEFSLDGKTIASTSFDKRIELWSAENGQLLHNLEGHKLSVSIVRFSSDGKVIASASRDGTVRLWNTDNGQLLHTLSGHKSEVFDMRFSQDGKVIASASRDKTVKLWSADNGQLLHTLSEHKGSVNVVRFKPGNIVTQSVVNLGNWWSGEFEKAWATLEEIFTPQTPAWGYAKSITRRGSVNKKSSDFAVRRGKLFDFGLLLNGQRFALTLSMRTEENQEIGVLAQIRPQNEYCLPQGLKLKVTLNHNTDKAESESAIARECDQIIQLAFSEAVGKQFKVEAIYQDAVVTEEFEL